MLFPLSFQLLMVVLFFLVFDFISLFSLLFSFITVLEIEPSMAH